MAIQSFEQHHAAMGSISDSAMVTSLSHPFTSSRKRVSLLSLPVELVLHILSHAHWSDYHSIRCTSKLLQELADSPNSLSAARYEFNPPSLPLAPSASPAPSRDSRSTGIHQIFSSASYQLGVPHYSIAIPDLDSPCRQNIVNVPIVTSDFRHDPFSLPKREKIVISWAHVKIITTDNRAHNSQSTRSYTFAPHQRALYVNNLIAGTGGKQASMRSRGGPSLRHEKLARERPCFITVGDIFSAFERDHPDLTTKLGGRAEFVSCHHVDYARVGVVGGSHFEVRWTWIDDRDR